MPLILIKDEEIQQLLLEEKTIPSGITTPHRALHMRNGNYQKSFDLTGANGSEFVVKLRQTVINPMNFSVILGYRIPGSWTVFRLRRYNSKHFHSNVLEGERFHDFHVHMATERYQKPGFNEDHYAMRTTRHYDFKSAIDCLLNDCGFSHPFADTPLFKGN